jgi:predicted HTH transcriptional regulator
MAKALSAFANSGGGHLIIGVADDGSFDGVEPFQGRTPTREWLEQVIPSLLSYPLEDFRVHQVEPSSPSAIPRGKVLVLNQA